jgi:hypothetical protein
MFMTGNPDPPRPEADVLRTSYPLPCGAQRQLGGYSRVKSGLFIQ